MKILTRIHQKPTNSLFIHKFSRNCKNRRHYQIRKVRQLQKRYKTDGCFQKYLFKNNLVVKELLLNTIRCFLIINNIILLLKFYIFFNLTYEILWLQAEHLYNCRERIKIIEIHITATQTSSESNTLTLVRFCPILSFK